MIIDETFAVAVILAAVVLAGLAAMVALRERQRAVRLAAELEAVRLVSQQAEQAHATQAAAAIARQSELEAEIARLSVARDRIGHALDRLPLPIWRRDEHLEIVDCNAAYAKAVEADRERVRREGLTLGGHAMSGRARALAELARAAQTPQSEEGHAVIAGSRRLLEFTEVPLPGGGTVGVALDVTDREEIQKEFARHVAAHGEVLEKRGITQWTCVNSVETDSARQVHHDPLRTVVIRRKQRVGARTCDRGVGMNLGAEMVEAFHHARVRTGGGQCLRDGAFSWRRPDRPAIEPKRIRAIDDDFAGEPAR